MQKLVTCLLVTYDIISIRKVRRIKFMEYKDTFSLKQRRCKKKNFFLKCLLLINKMVMENCRSKQKKSSMAWIEHKNAFDNILRKLILNVLNIL